MKNFIIQFLLFLALHFSLHATNYYIKPTGNDSNNGLTPNTAFKTIQTATNKVKAGDSIIVFDGLYKGFDHFYKNSGLPNQEIVYFAAGQNVIINQSCGRGFDGLNIEGNDYIQVIGFKVNAIADPNGSGEDGIRAVLANHITIKNCIVDSCYRGIFTGYTDDFLVENNICKRSYGEHGIYVSNNSDRVVLRFNTCFNNKAAGIQLNPDLSSGEPGISENVTIYNNVCYSNRIGLNLQGIYHSQVYNNLLYNNGSGGGGNGITLFHGDAATGCKDVKVYNNTVITPPSSQWCILAIESDSLFVKNNILLSFSNKGCLDIESSCTHYFGDYNLLNDKMTVDQGSSYISFAAWQMLGNDAHSILVSNNNLPFANLNTNDYHLASNSVAVNSGTNEVMNLVQNDLDQNQRPQGAQYDIGCYEKLSGTKISTNLYKDKELLSFDKMGFGLKASVEDTEIYLFDMVGNFISKAKFFNYADFLPGMYFYSVSKFDKVIDSGKIVIGPSTK